MGCESHRAFLFGVAGELFCGAVEPGNLELEGEVDEVGSGGAEAEELGGGDGGGEKGGGGEERVGEGGGVGEGGVGEVEEFGGERGGMAEVAFGQVEGGADLNGIGESFGGIVEQANRDDYFV